ncbi:MAG TPA: AI-2E family transporter, partial [Oculatellaceae cyanobacterium]
MPERINLLSNLSRNNLIILCIAFLFVVLTFLAEALTDIVVLLAATILIAYLLLGPVQLVDRALLRLTRKGEPLLSPGLRKTVAVILVYLLLATVIIVIVFSLIPPLMLQIQDFAQDIPQYIQRLRDPAAPSRVFAPELPFPAQQQWLLNSFAHLGQKLIMTYSQYVSQMGEALLNIGASAVATLVYALTLLVLVFILLQDGRGLKEGFVKLMPDRVEGLVSGFLERFHCHASRFIRCHALMSLLAGSMVYLLLLLLGSKYALLLGLFYGFASLVPVVGPWVGLLTLSGFLAFGNHPGNVIPLVLYVGIFYVLKTAWLWPRMLPRQYD